MVVDIPSPPDSALLQQIVSTELLAARPAKAPNYQREAQAMARLADVFANAPDELAQALADAALELTGAHAAGISLEETSATPQIFRWVATAGTYAQYLNGTMPRDFSPCGEVLERNTHLLMRDPVRLYGYISALHEPAHEVLLVPFHNRNKAIGTVWIVSHDDGLVFDLEDLRIVQTLTRFAAAAMHSTGLVRRLSAAHALQQEADASKDRFLAMLSHEMRSPLSAISLSAQVLKLTPEDAIRRGTAVASIERQTTALSRLINDITDVVAIRAGKLSLTLAPVTAQEIVARALEACGKQLGVKDQLLEVQLPEQPLMVMGDLMRLTQVVVNMVNNAIKYTPEKGRITVSATPNGDCIDFVVADTGMGLTQEAMAKVFDMFMQVSDDIHRSQYGGLGIGLALVKQLVELHGGSVAVSSDGPGRGCTFTVSLKRL